MNLYRAERRLTRVTERALIPLIILCLRAYRLARVRWPR